MDSGAVWLLGLSVVLGIRVYFQHREKMAKISPTQDKPDAKVMARIEALEAKCEKLQEQVSAAHFLIHDEQKQLDRRLAERLESNDVRMTDTGAERKVVNPARVQS